MKDISLVLGKVNSVILKSPSNSYFIDLAAFSIGKFKTLHNRIIFPMEPAFLVLIICL